MERNVPRLCEYSGRGGGTTLVVEATICVVLLGLVVGQCSCRLEVVFVLSLVSRVLVGQVLFT